MIAHLPATPVNKLPRVAFVAHALLEGYLSTQRIDHRLRQLGKSWPNPGSDPGYIKWFSFPFVLDFSREIKMAWADFYIIPVLAPVFMDACRDGRAFSWVERVALDAIEEARRDEVELTIGWGAAVKNATDHGAKFLERHPDLPSWVSTTHGDAGTAALVLRTLRDVGVKAGSRVAIIGANGAIGDVLARALPSLQPAEILLVGRKGRNTAEDARNLDRLLELKGRVVHGNVEVHLDKSVACLEHHSEVVIVATNGMGLSPKEVPEGSLVLDMCTPAACAPEHDWSRQMVLTAGCGELSSEMLPRGFGTDTGSEIWDVGAGALSPAPRCVWGCFAETLAWPLFGRKGHVAGQKIDLNDLAWANESLSRMDCVPQPPLSHSKSVDPRAVLQFVEQFGLRRLLLSGT